MLWKKLRSIQIVNGWLMATRAPIAAGLAVERGRCGRDGVQQGPEQWRVPERHQPVATADEGGKITRDQHGGRQRQEDRAVTSNQNTKDVHDRASANAASVPTVSEIVTTPAVTIIELTKLRQNACSTQTAR